MALREEYLAYIAQGLQQDRSKLAEALAAWRTSGPVGPFGYAPPGLPLALGCCAAFLHRHGERDPRLAKFAKECLFAYQDLAAELPAELKAPHPEYHLGTPPLDGLFMLPHFLAALADLRAAGALSQEERALAAQLTAASLHPLFHFPEWGAHNRAMLRAASLAMAAATFPEHEDAPAWQALARVLAEDSWGRWTIEDAALYLPIWLRALIWYADAQGGQEYWHFPQTRFYYRLILELLTPLGSLPDYGDSWWMPSAGWYIPCLERAARELREPHLKFAAETIYRQLRAQGLPDAGTALLLLDAWRWADDSLQPERPFGLYPAAADDLVAKKVVMRTGWEDEATYLCLNFRDEGDFGLAARDYLRQTLAVMAEKAHHGHADENSIVSFISGGSVLLHDAGYREVLPGGSAYRGDYYHNRLVWRRSLYTGEQPLLEFLEEGGQYHLVRTQRLHRERLSFADYSRTRVLDEERGLSWDRALLLLPELGCAVLFELLTFLKSGPITLASLLWSESVQQVGQCLYCLRTERIEGWTNPQRCQLLAWLGTPDGVAVRIERARRHRQEESVLAASWAGQVSAGQGFCLATVLWPRPWAEGALGEASFELICPQEQQEGLALQLQVPGKRLTIGVRRELARGVEQSPVRPTYDPARSALQFAFWHTDAALFIAEEGQGGSRYAVVEATFLRKEQNVLFEAEPAALFQPDASLRAGIPRWRKWEWSTPA